MSPKYLRNLLLTIPAVVALNTVACSNSEVTFEGIEQSRLKLADGSSISQSATDDYSPIVVRLSNDYLALVFASTRTCAEICNGNHNIFFSVSTTPYMNDGFLPAFSPPKPIVTNGTAVNFSSRLRLAVFVSGGNITIYNQVSGGNISTTSSFAPVAGFAQDVGTFVPPINDNYCHIHNLLGMDATGLMIAANTAGTQTYRFNPSVPNMPCPTAGMTNPKLATGTHISLIHAASSGIADSFFVSDTAGNISAQTVTSNGPQIALLKDALKAAGLISTGVSVMHAANEVGELITFSAAPAVGQKSDMYVLLTPRPAILWQRYVGFGQQPVP